MKNCTSVLLKAAIAVSLFYASPASAQLPFNNTSLPACNYPVFLESFSSSQLVNGGSDLYNGLPRNGSWQIVSSVDQLGGGGYLPITAPGGGNFLAAHTSNTRTDRVWYNKVAVQPGMTYSFCASVALLKNLGGGAVYLLGVYANGTLLGTGRVNFDWSQICGSYTVPPGVHNVEFSIRDPKKGLFFVAINSICISSVRPPADRGINTAITSANSMSLYPNPAASNASVRYNATAGDDALIRVYDNSGRIVLQQKKRVSAGVNNIVLTELNTAKAGTYLVQLSTNAGSLNQKLIINK